MGKLLDLFCGAGGAAMGYHRAGYDDIVGVDLVPQPRYPFRFVQDDALAYLAQLCHTGEMAEYDLIHASPPCQAHSIGAKFKGVADSYDDLVPATRRMLKASGRPYVIENVPLAPLDNPLELCGSMFGLPLIRHRLFECNPAIWFPPGPHACQHLYTASRNSYSTFANGATAITVAGNNYRWEDGEIAMDIDWMSNRRELSQAIPPAYTEYIGRQMLEAQR